MKKFSKRLLAVMLSVMMVLTALPFGAITAQAATLAQAKNNYIAKVNDMRNNGVVYTNMLPAYLAYVEACKETAGQEQADALQAAVDNMTAFDESTMQGKQIISINGTEATGGYGNVLYSADPGTVQYKDLPHGYLSWSNGILNYSGDWFIYQRGGVLLYDGVTDAKLPVIFADKENEGKYAFRFGYVTESGDRLENVWHGVTTTGSSDSSMEVNIAWTNSTDYSVPISVDSGTYYDAENKHGGRSSYWNFSNALVFTLNDATLNKKISKFEWNTEAYWGNLVTGAKHFAEGEQRLFTTEPVYILNYKKLLDKMQASITKYKDTYLDVTSDSSIAGGSTEVFAAFDNATTLNLSNANYHYDTDLEAGYENAYTDLQDAIDDLDGVTDAEGSINTIVSMITLYENNMATNPFRINLANTYKLYLKAKECFDAYIYGQNREDSFIDTLKETAGKFEKAVTESTPIADVDMTGHYHPADGVKFFNGDNKSGDGAYTYYNTPQYAGSHKEGQNNITNTPAANLLYYAEASSTPIANSGSTSSSNYVAVRIYHSNNIVLLYDGITTPKFPVISTYANNGGSYFDSYGWVQNVYPTDADAVAFSKATVMNDNSASFAITKQTAFTGSNYSSSNDNRVWVGRSSNKKSNASPIGFDRLWTKDTSGWINSSDPVRGDADLGGNHGTTALWIDRLGGVFGTGAAATVDYVGSFSDVTYTGEETEEELLAKEKQQYLSAYDHLNWNVQMSWGGSMSSSTYYGGVLSTNAKINVINIQPILKAQATLLANDNVKDVLKQIYLYDEDSADVISFLQKIDGIGSFNPAQYDETSNPNGYHYETTTGGTHGYSANVGVDKCIYDMKTAVSTFTGVADAVVNEEGKTVADDTTVGDGYIIAPSSEEKEKDSTSTEATNPDDSNWYGDLRKSLLNPLEEDPCYDDEAWTAYKTALTAAQNAISTPAVTTNSYYPEKPVSGNTKTFSDYAKDLNDAKAALLAAPGKHSYLYADEDADQLSDWECQYKATHTHGTADMSAYNELEIAYNTIDQKAYEDAAKTEMEAAYNDGNVTDENISFVEVKTRPTAKGEMPQTFVDNGIIKLLTAINDAAGESVEDSQLNFYNVNFNVVIDGDEENPVEVMKDQAMSYGTTASFVATDAAGFPTDSTCYKWTVALNGQNPQTIYHNGNSLVNFVQDNTTVTAYVNSATPEEKVKVMIYGPTKLKLYEVNVNKNAEVNFGSVDEDGNITVTIDGKDYTVASTPAYLNTSWTIGVEQNEEVYEGGTYTETVKDEETEEDKEIVKNYTVEYLRAKRGLSYLKIYPHFTKRITNGYTVTASGTTDATIIVNGQDKKAKTATGVEYDDQVTIRYNPITDEDDENYKGEFYGIAVNISEMAGGTTARYVPISYGTEFYFRANSPMNVYPIYKTVVQKGDSTANVYTVDDASQTKITNPTDRYYLNRHLPFVLDLFDTTNVNGKYVFRVMYTQNLPESVKITEHGYTYLRLRSAETVDAISAGESDIVYGKSWNINGTTYSVTQKPSTKDADAKSNQFSFSTSIPSGYAYQASRGYVKFTYDFEQKIVDANEQEITYEAPIEAISYGRADFYIHN